VKRIEPISPRRETVTVRVGELSIGSGYPVVVQSMTNTDTRDPAATLRQIENLAAAGCELVRLAVPDKEAAARLAEPSLSVSKETTWGYPSPKVPFAVVNVVHPVRSPVSKLPLSIKIMADAFAQTMTSTAKIPIFVIFIVGLACL